MQRRRRIAAVVTITAFAVAMAACSGGQQVTKPELVGRHWTATTIDGFPVDPPAPWIQFDKQGVQASTGCNSVGGDYSISEGTITWVGGVVTQKACEPPLDSQEEAFLNITREPMKVTLGEGTMTLRSSVGRIEFREG